MEDYIGIKHISFYCEEYNIDKSLVIENTAWNDNEE